MESVAVMARIRQNISDCPECGATASFGNSTIHRTTLYRRCTSCSYRSTITLPSVHKKIIYIDQSLLSKAFKGGDSRAKLVIAKVDRLSRMQLLVSPRSDVHDDETHLWTGYNGKTPEGLIDFIDGVAHGIRFRPTYEVEQTQVCKGFKAFRDKLPSSYLLQEQDALSGNVHDWHDYFRVKIDRYFPNPEELRRSKKNAINQLVGTFDSFMKSNTTFQQNIDLEIKSAGNIYLAEYVKDAFCQVIDDSALGLDSPIVSQCVSRLLRMLPDDMPDADQLSEVKCYFASAHFARLPSWSLAARIYASLKSMVRCGSFLNRERAIEKLSGFYYDVKYIAAYAPYSDAIFVDNQMASMIKEPKIGVCQEFGTKVFSMSSIDEFLAYLDCVESNASAEHSLALDLAYGSAL